MATRILKYATAHDAGTIINPKIVEGQIYGGALHGLGGALSRSTLGRGRPVPDRLVHRLPRADRRRGAADRHGGHRDAVAVDDGRLQGLGESASMTAPAAVANAVSDALGPLGRKPRSCR